MAAPLLLDGHVKPLLRGVFHEVGFFVALLAGALLVAWAPAGTARWGCLVYAASLAAMLGTSALYHRPTWSERARARMRRADHSTIFVLIAGTYTPLALTLPAGSAHTMLAVAWGCALVGVLRALFWVNAPKGLVAALAVAVGWLVVLYFGELEAYAGRAVLVLLGVGGVLYSVGALTYALRRPNPWPNVFGYHEVFHALVVVAAILHFVVVVLAVPAIRG
jgi:hemolysin III